jgi:hypothetical protein
LGEKNEAKLVLDNDRGPGSMRGVWKVLLAAGEYSGV